MNLMAMGQTASFQDLKQWISPCFMSSKLQIDLCLKAMCTQQLPQTDWLLTNKFSNMWTKVLVFNSFLDDYSGSLRIQLVTDDFSQSPQKK